VTPGAIASAVSALESRATFNLVGPRGRVAWRVWPSATAQAPPLVLFPGGFGSWRHWFRNIDALATRYEVHCVEPPGLGDSASPASSPPDLDELADAVLAGVDEVLGRGASAALVGFSFGGIVAGRVAARLRGQVRALVLSGSGGFGLACGPLPAAVRIHADMTPCALDAALRHNLAGFMLSAPAVDDMAVYLERESVKRSRLNYTQILNSTALRESLEVTTCPIGSLCGGNDPFMTGYFDDYAALFSRLRPGCPFETIDGASHWVMYEQPDRYVSRLFAILHDLGYPGTGVR